MYNTTHASPLRKSSKSHVSMRQERPKSVSVMSGLKGSVQGWSREKGEVVRRG